MKKIIDAMDKGIGMLEKIVLFGSITVMLIVTAIEVLDAKVLHANLMWTTEVNRIMLVWCILSGASVAAGALLPPQAAMPTTITAARSRARIFFITYFLHMFIYPGSPLFFYCRTFCPKNQLFFGAPLFFFSESRLFTPAYAPSAENCPAKSR